MRPGTRQAPESTLALRHTRTCTDPTVRAWNEDRCAGLEARTCEGDACSYHHFGNCSGLLMGEGRFLTAAHCVNGLTGERAAGSAVLAAGREGPLRLTLGSIYSGKKDFDHHWVAVDDVAVGREPLDLAVALIDDGGLSPFESAPLPAIGGQVFVLSYPRLEGRGSLAPDSVRPSGTLVASFGRLADANTTGAPLCNVDGMQEHWALAAACPVAEITLDGQQSWTGPISYRPALFTYDSVNGASGAPVFDTDGRLVAVNFTLASAVNPQDRFSADARMVATPAVTALEWVRGVMRRHED